MPVYIRKHWEAELGTAASGWKQKTNAPRAPLLQRLPGGPGGSQPAAPAH